MAQPAAEKILKPRESKFEGEVAGTAALPPIPPPPQSPQVAPLGWPTAVSGPAGCHARGGRPKGAPCPLGALPPPSLGTAHKHYSGTRHLGGGAGWAKSSSWVGQCRHHKLTKCSCVTMSPMGWRILKSKRQ